LTASITVEDQPSLLARMEELPLVVLSSNDSPCIARFNPAKVLGR
jgi:hypothetical protein